MFFTLVLKKVDNVFYTSFGGKMFSSHFTQMPRMYFTLWCTYTNEKTEVTASEQEGQSAISRLFYA